MRLSSVFEQLTLGGMVLGLMGCEVPRVSHSVLIPDAPQPLGSPQGPAPDAMDPSTDASMLNSMHGDAGVIVPTTPSPDAATPPPPIPDAYVPPPPPPDAYVAPPPPPDAYVAPADAYVAPPPPPPPNPCVPDNVAFPPAGYILGEQKTLTKLWMDTTGAGIGAQLAQVKITTGRYEAYTFSHAEFGGVEPMWEFNADMLNIQYNDNASPAAENYIAISECVGDLRVANAAATDPTLQPACRVRASEGPFLLLNFGTPRVGMCNLSPSKSYAFNVVFDDPSDGYNATQACNYITGKLVCAFKMAVLPRGG